MDDSQLFLGFSLSIWIVIFTALTAIFTGVSAWMVIYARRINKMNAPRIVESKFSVMPVTGTKFFTITLVNPSQTQALVTDVRVRKRKYGLYIFKVRSQIYPPTFFSKEDFSSVFSKDVQYSFTGQADYMIYLPASAEEATYKISVRTLAGWCSTIYHPSQSTSEK